MNINKWLNLHYGTTSANLGLKHNGDSLFANYEKSGCGEFYRQIASLRDEAKKRASDLLKQALSWGDRPHHENPSTRVFILVDALEKISRKI